MITRIILYAAFLFFYIGNISAQVTIGSDHEPNKGALLDLKEIEDSDTKQGKANSTRGLLLPRVKLTTLNDLSDISISVGENPANYQGMVVYNVVGGTNFCDSNPIQKGLYVWSGTEWVSLTIGSANYGMKEIVDARDNSSYLYRSFGNAGEWMVENLRFVDPSFGFSQAGDTEKNLQRIFYPQVNGGTETDPANISTWDSPHGVLYSYSAATYGIRDTEAGDLGNTNDAVIIGVCPNGWHIPNDYEWSRLEEEIAKNPQEYSTSTFSIPWQDSYNTAMGDRPDDVEDAHGAAMKYMCALPETGNSTNGTGFPSDKGGFGGLLIGTALAGKAESYASISHFMSGSTYNADRIYGRRLYFDKSKVGRIDVDRKELMSVRCKKIVKPSLIDRNMVVRISDQTITITTNPLDLKGGTVRWISPSNIIPDPENNRKAKLQARIPSIHRVKYEFTTDEGDVLTGTFEVTIIR